MRAPLGWLAAACVVQALSCSRSSEPAVRSEAAEGSVVTRAADAHASPSASRAADTRQPDAPPADPVRSQVYAWSRALDHHDMPALDALYGQDLCFYGEKWAKAKVLAAKSQALSADPAYHQEIVGNIDLSPSGYAAIATFVKRSGSGDRVQDVRARLLLKNFAGDYGRPMAPMSIVGENDGDVPPPPALLKCEGAAANSQRNVPALDARCDDAASAVFNKLPVVIKAKASLKEDYAVRAKSEPDVGVGGIGPQDDGEDSGSFSVAVGMQTPQRFEPVAGYRVYRATGGFEVFGSFGPDARVAPSDLRAIEAACKL
jgi:hypothetical protein